LQVASIMEGSVRKAGDRVRVTAQLVDASNGYHLWSDNFDRNVADIFAIQEEIARNVVNAVRPTLQAPPAFDMQKRAPRDIHAYEFYLRGRQLEGRTTELSWRQAPLMFRRALEIDPEYAQAWAGLADSLCELVMWRIEVAHTGALEEAKAAAHRALELDPDLAEAHVAKAHALSMAGDDERATEAFERALTLDPELYVANYYYARHCIARNPTNSRPSRLPSPPRTARAIRIARSASPLKDSRARPTRRKSTRRTPARTTWRQV
jgi:adenylate cyclase